MGCTIFRSISSQPRSTCSHSDDRSDTGTAWLPALTVCAALAALQKGVREALTSRLHCLHKWPQSRLLLGTRLPLWGQLGSGNYAVLCKFRPIKQNPTKLPESSKIIRKAMRREGTLRKEARRRARTRAGGGSACSARVFRWPLVSGAPQRLRAGFLWGAPSDFIGQMLFFSAVFSILLPFRPLPCPFLNYGDHLASEFWVDSAHVRPWQDTGAWGRKGNLGSSPSPSPLSPPPGPWLLQLLQGVLPWSHSYWCMVTGPVVPLPPPFSSPPSGPWDFSLCGFSLNSSTYSVKSCAKFPLLEIPRWAPLF